MHILITLCARGGSKGIPGKNIKPINGKPLIALSIETAKQFAKEQLADIELSTDDDEIKKVAASFGIVTSYQRPAHLGSDSAGKIDTIKDLLYCKEQATGKRYDYVLDLDVTSPLRTEGDLKAALELIVADDAALNIFSVNKANRNPYFNMVEQQDNGYYGLVKKGSFVTRQSAPKVYDLNASFYFYKRVFFENETPTVINDHSLVYVMPHICFDLDHSVDFEFMEYLMINNKLGFKL